MSAQERQTTHVDTADEAVNIAVKALRSVYGGEWGFDVRQSVKEKDASGEKWVVDIYVVFWGVRRVTIRSYPGSIERIESVS